MWINVVVTAAALMLPSQIVNPSVTLAGSPGYMAAYITAPLPAAKLCGQQGVC